MGFKIENGVLVKYTEEKGVKDVVIPDGVTEIGDSAFLGCSSLTSVTIPDSVTHIGENAFSRCTALKTVITANASLLMKNSLMVSFLVYEKKPSDSYFYAFSANRETSNYQYSLQRNMWNRYDDELIGTEPKFKYRLVECLLAAISRLKHPIDLREYCKQAYVALLQKNIKKLVSVAEQLDCPEVIQWMFDLNIIHSENFKAVKGVLAASSVPSIKAFSAEEKVPNAPQEPALKLPVLTEMEKYQGLETAVLQKNQDQIQFYLENYPLQENMNKLFALAIRCADVKILSMLVEGIKKYNPSYLNSNDDDTLLYFGKDEYYISLYSALHLLPNYEPDLSLPTISDEERLLVFDYLSHNALANVNSEEFLLYVIYYCDDVLYRELKKNGINKITKNVEEVSDDKNTYRKLNIYWDYDKARILGIDNDYALLACLERLLECSQAAIIDFPGSFYTDRFCSEILFDFFIEKTSMMSKYSKKNMIRGIIQCANAKNLSQILTEGWIKTENDVDYWLETAHQMNNVSPEIITLLM